MFPLNFVDAVRNLGRTATVQIANQVRPPARYLFASVLPDREIRSYHAEDANLTVRTTLAPMKAMDGTFGPVGLMQASSFREGLIGLGPRYALTEENRRHIREMLEALVWQGATVGGLQTAMENELLNIQDKLILQSMWDTEEYLRAKALVTGAINWTFGDKTVSIDYGVPSANFLSNRTGTAAWDSSASAFWTDIDLLQAKLNYDVAAYIAHPTTITKIIGNTVNNLMVPLGQNWLGMAEPVTIQRYTTIGGNQVPFPDGRYTITLIPYGEECEIYDLNNPGKTTKIPFMPTGKILALQNNRNNEYRVGQGATDDPNAALPLGYTHVGPTEEGNGATGHWLQMYTPEDMPQQVRFRGAVNFLPVLQQPSKIAVASSDLS